MCKNSIALVKRARDAYLEDAAGMTSEYGQGYSDGVLDVTRSLEHIMSEAEAEQAANESASPWDDTMQAGEGWFVAEALDSDEYWMVEYSLEDAIDTAEGWVCRGVSPIRISYIVPNEQGEEVVEREWFMKSARTTWLEV